MGSANAVPEHKAADYFEMERDIAVANNMYDYFHFQYVFWFFFDSRQHRFIFNISQSFSILWLLELFFVF